MTGFRPWTMAALALALSAGAAEAGPATPSAGDLLGSFNVITQGGFSTSSETDGAVLVGGNLTGGSGTLDKNGLSPSVSGFGQVNVYGNTAGANYNTNNRTVDVGTASQSAGFSNTSPAPVYNYAFPYSIGTVWSQLTNLSSTLSTFSTPGNTSSLSGSAFNAAPNGSGVAVLNITGAQLQGVGNPTFNLNGAQLLIINVDASSYSTQSGQNFTNGGNVNLSPNIIWNFYDATGVVNFATEFVGTVLAPGASVTNSSPIDGTLVAGSYSGSAELHSYPVGSTVLLNNFGSVPVPEPSSLALLAAGLAGMGLVRRRRA